MLKYFLVNPISYGRSSYGTRYGSAAGIAHELGKILEEEGF